MDLRAPWERRKNIFLMSHDDLVDEMTEEIRLREARFFRERAAANPRAWKAYNAAQERYTIFHIPDSKYWELHELSRYYDAQDYMLADDIEFALKYFDPDRLGDRDPALVLKEDIEFANQYFGG